MLTETGECDILLFLLPSFELLDCLVKLKSFYKGDLKDNSAKALNFVYPANESVFIVLSCGNADIFVNNFWKFKRL